MAGIITFWLIAGWITIFYGSFVEPRMIVEHEQEIELIQGDDQPFTIAVLSDLHVGPYRKEHSIMRLVEKIEERNPDAVVLLGDFVYKSAESLPELSPLYFLSESYPVFAVLGNHDYDLSGNQKEPNDELAVKVRAALKTLGVTVLENDGLPIANGRLYLAGLQEIWTHRTDIDAALQTNIEGLPVIALAHNPDTVAAYTERHDIALTLSGHTHGGQIRLPFIGPVGIIPTELGQKIDKGLFTINNHQVLITSGVGESGPRARLFNPPEIIYLTIK